MATEPSQSTPATENSEFALGVTQEYRCHLALIREEEGDYSVIVLNLPGVGTSGATLETALTNIEDAVRTTLSAYHELGMPIPWRPSDDLELPSGAVSKWIVVHG